jgi:trans-aconitate methyltransferase
MDAGRPLHWNEAYALKGETGVSWFEEVPELSLELIQRFGPGRPSVIDIGGGASRLVDCGLRLGWRITMLDLSADAIRLAQRRLGVAAAAVDWIEADVTAWRPTFLHDVWHDRAAFHFLTEPDERAAYARCLRSALRSGGHAIIATFAPDGPERCSGLRVRRYDAEGIAEAIGAGFTIAAACRRTHPTPWGATQSFQYTVLARGAA